MKLAKEHVCRVQEKKTYFGAIIDGFVVRQTFVTATPYNVQIMHLVASQFQCVICSNLRYVIVIFSK
jgi:hypothetical protein